MRIAIIECDVPMLALKEKYGDYTEYFRTLLTVSVEDSVAKELELVQYEAYLDAALPTTLADLAAFDGLILTGSKFTSYENDPWILHTMDLIKLAYTHIKVVGICFGHQLIARALGGTVGPNPLGWEIATTSSSWECELIPQLSALRLQQMHRDIVIDAPPTARVVGGNEICRVQVMYEAGRYFSMQGHPEFNSDTVKTVLKVRMDQNIVPAEYGADAMARADSETDASLVGAAIVKFFSTPIGTR